jgi:dCTP deaminase
MILAKDEILKEIKSKRVKIEPFSKGSVGPASIDLTLSDELRIFEHPGKTVEINESADYKKYTKLIKIKKGYVLKPHELVLGITKEKITLPGDICAWLNSRSRFARLGLMSHITAPFVSPGVSNKQVLEIYNAGRDSLKLIPGEKICQLILQKCIGNAEYKGKFKNQRL